MSKSIAAVDAIVYVGMIAISALMFAQLPQMINEVNTVLQKQAAIEEAKTLENLKTLSSAAPGDVKITHTKPKIGEQPGGTIEITKTSSGVSTVSQPSQPPSTITQTVQCSQDQTFLSFLNECRQNVEIQNARNCEGQRISSGYYQWNWDEHNCYIVPGPTTPSYCRNNVKDVDETGVDCGGSRCNPC